MSVAPTYTKRGDELRVGDVIREVADARPEHVAVRIGEHELTYAALDERSSRLAQALLASGVRAGSRIAYLDRTAPEVIELLFAAGKIGAVLVPLNWRLAPPELASVLDDDGTGLRVLLVVSVVSLMASLVMARALPGPRVVRAELAA